VGCSYRRLAVGGFGVDDDADVRAGPADDPADEPVVGVLAAGGAHAGSELGLVVPHRAHWVLAPRQRGQAQGGYAMENGSASAAGSRDALTGVRTFVLGSTRYTLMARPG